MVTSVRRAGSPTLSMRALAGALVTLVLLAGCSTAYQSERLFWRAERLNGAVLKDPKQATPQQFAAAITAYQRVLDRTPGTIWAARADYSIAALHLLQKQYAQARETYRHLLQNYPGYSDLALRSRAGIAKTYELEGNWDEAAKAYRQISEYHPWTRVGLEAPLYVAAIYQKRQQLERATEAFQQASSFYIKLIPQATSPALGYAVKGYLALTYQRLGKWDEAVRVYEELVTVPAESVNRPLVLMTLGSLYQIKANEPQKARELFETLIREFPDHPFAKAAGAAKAQLEQMSNQPAPSTPEPVAEQPVAALEAPTQPPAQPAQPVPAPGVAR